MGAKRRLIFASGPRGYRRYGRRVRRKLMVVTPSPIGRRGASLAVRRGRILRALGGRLGRFGLKGLAVGMGAKAVIGTARRLRRALKTETFADNQDIDSRTLYNASISAIDKGEEINEREKQDVQLSGFKIRGEITNKSESPMYVNVAVINNRDISQDLGVEFFRGDHAAKAQDFDTTLTGIEFHSTPINPDKIAIVKHKRYRLPGATEVGNGHAYMNLEWYIKMNRNLTYDNINGASVDATSNVQLIWWCDKFGAAAGSSAATNVAAVRWKVNAFYHNVN